MIRRGLLIAALIASLAACGPSGPPEAASRGDTWTRSADGMVMLYVPAGEFTMGSAADDVAAESNEMPQHRVHLDAYWIDQTEVTNAQYRQCVEKGACSPPTTCDQGDPTYGDTAKDDHPVVCVDWKGAVTYCVWAGAQLPTEAQWEKAARGTDARIYPWGDTFDGSWLNHCDARCEFEWKEGSYDDGYERTAPVGSYPSGASPYWVQDMAGNVYEWVADWYDEGYYAASPVQNPAGPAEGDSKVVRGGGWSSNSNFIRAALRFHFDPAYRDANIGFRCALLPGD